MDVGSEETKHIRYTEAENGDLSTSGVDCRLLDV